MMACSDDSINTELAIDPAAPVFQGHYPQFPIFPGIYLIETALQAIECFVQMHSRGSVRMTGLKSARLLAPVRPGDLLRCQARLLDPAFCADASQWEVVCSVDGAAVAKLRMTVRTQ
jgi:3-hydroxyacyl-[acyl-carrier-protein] dehydratase